MADTSVIVIRVLCLASQCRDKRVGADAMPDYAENNRNYRRYRNNKVNQDLSEPSAEKYSISASARS